MIKKIKSYNFIIEQILKFKTLSQFIYTNAPFYLLKNQLIFQRSTLEKKNIIVDNWSVTKWDSILVKKTYTNTSSLNTDTTFINKILQQHIYPLLLAHRQHNPAWNMIHTFQFSAVFSFLYLKKNKISKIYVRFGKFQKYMGGDRAQI